MLSICHRRLWWAQSSARSVSSSLICRPENVSALIKLCTDFQVDKSVGGSENERERERERGSCPEAQFGVRLFSFSFLFCKFVQNILCFAI